MAADDWFGGAGLAFQALATAMTAGGQLDAGNLQQGFGYYNAAVLRQRGSIAVAQATERARIQDVLNARNLGEEKAAAGVSGVDANQGSPLLVMADTATQGELQKHLLLYQGQMEDYTAQQQAQLDTASGEAAGYAGRIGATGTLLTGAGKLAYGAYQLYGRGGTKVPPVDTGPGLPY